MAEGGVGGDIAVEVEQAVHVQRRQDKGVRLRVIERANDRLKVRVTIGMHRMRAMESFGCKPSS